MHAVSGSWLARSWAQLQATWDAPDGPMWAKLPHVLLAGLILRVAVALASDNIWRTDESLTYLEQAHRFVFGYGLIAAEYLYGARTLLVSAPPIAVLQLCALLGLDHPDQYIPIMRLTNVALSMTVPLGAYFLGRRMLTETAGRAACIVASLWYELIVLAPHALAELYASYLFFGALALLRTRMDTLRCLCGGILLGLAGAVRVSYFPAVAIFGLLLLALLAPRARLAGAAGVLLGLAVWGLTDWLATGRWFGSLPAYLEYHAVFVQWHRAREPFIRDLLPLLSWSSLGLLPIALAWIALRWRRLPLLALPTLAVFAVHASYVAAREYSNYALVLMLASVGAAMLWAGSQPSLQAAMRLRGKSLLVAVAAGVSAFSLLGLLPGHQFVEARNNDYFSSTPTQIPLFRALSREPAGSVTAIWYDLPQGVIAYGGAYYHIHHDAPIYFNNPEMIARIKWAAADREPPTHPSHVITRLPSCFPDHEVRASWQGLYMLARRSGESQSAEPLERDAPSSTGALLIMRDTREDGVRSSAQCRWSRPREWRATPLHDPSIPPPALRALYPPDGR